MHRFLRVSTLALFPLPALLASGARAQSFQGIGDLPGGAFESYASGVSADGTTVVGYGIGASGKTAVYWRNGVLTGLGDLAGGAVDSIAFGTNQDGSVIVGQGLDATAHRPVRWNGPAYGIVQLPQPVGFAGGARAAGISLDGNVITGWATDNQLTAYTNVTAFRIDGAVLTSLPYAVVAEGKVDSGAYYNPSADGSIAVGRVRLGGIAYAPAYWTGSTLHVAPGLGGIDQYGQIFGASADGTVRVGVSTSPNASSTSTGEPCRWVGDTPFGLGKVPGAPNFFGDAIACNANGSVIVGRSSAPGGTRAFHWTAATGMRELSLVLTQDYGLNLAGWTLLDARSITPDGSVIVGYGTNPAGFQEGWIAELGCATSTIQCTAKLNSVGCLPAIFAVGIPSATATSGFSVRATELLNNMPGLMIYGTTGGASIPFQGGTLCVASPVFRAPGMNSGGSAVGSDCTGTFNLDVNAFAHGLAGGSPQAALTVPGTVVDCQFWARDTGFTAPNNSQLSNSLRYTVCN
jgi:uncharacterized membrane protein